jgi:hypothetical protein
MKRTVVIYAFLALMLGLALVGCKKAAEETALPTDTEMGTTDYATATDTTTVAQ